VSGVRESDVRVPREEIGENIRKVRDAGQIPGRPERRMGGFGRAGAGNGGASWGQLGKKSLRNRGVSITKHSLNSAFILDPLSLILHHPLLV
jgi:hypothetical protein